MAGGFHVEVNVEGLEDALRVVGYVRNLGEDPQPLLEIAGSVLEASTIERFQSQQGPDGIKWEPSKRALRDGGRTLFDHGDLEDSIRSDVRQGEVEIGFDDLNKPPGVVAALHFGSHRQTVVVGHTRVVNEAFGVPLPGPREQNVRPHGRMTNLPARPMIGVGTDDPANVEAAWLEHLRSLFSAG